MKKYIFFISMLCLVLFFIQKNYFIHHDSLSCWLTQENCADYVEQIYGKNGINLPLDDIFFLQKLFLNLIQLTPQEESKIAVHLIKKIDEQLIQSEDNFHQRILTLRKNHLQKYVTLEKSIQLDQKIDTLTQNIITYMNLEDNALVATKNRALFYAATKSFPLPPLVNFFDQEEDRAILLQDILDTGNVKVQLLESFVFQFAMDMTIAIIVSQGASLASSIYASQSQKLYARLMKNKQAIESNMKSFLQKSQDNQQQSLQTLISLFSQAQQNIQKQTNDAAKNIQAELAFLHKNISLEKPQQNFLFEQVEFDEIFTKGDIPTSLQHVWKDPFKVGAWTYNSTTKMFSQNTLFPVFITLENESGGIEKSSIQAENNSIFTEFYTSEKKYTIQARMTIDKIEFPFFVGIIFNKSRWISGNYESVRKCRMFGIYGASASDINFCFAEQYLANEQEMKSLQLTDPIQTPLHQILQGNTQQGPVDPIIIQNINLYPLQVDLTIITEPTQVTIKTMIGEKSQQFSINTLNPQLFIHHGIGCISPGAQASFMFQTPQSIMT